MEMNRYCCEDASNSGMASALVRNLELIAPMMSALVRIHSGFNSELCL